MMGTIQAPAGGSKHSLPLLCAFLLLLVVVAGGGSSMPVAQAASVNGRDGRAAATTGDDGLQADNSGYLNTVSSRSGRGVLSAAKGVREARRLIAVLDPQPPIRKPSWKPYNWTALDWALITYDGFSQKTLCEDAAGYVFTQGNNTSYYGCSSARCCMPILAPLPAWRRYGWSALERDLMSYDNLTESSLCTSAGAKYTGGNNQAYPGCGGGLCCIPANATFPAWRPYGWSSIERDMMAKGATESSLCAAAGATYTRGNNAAYPGCGRASVCCIRSNSSFPACNVSEWSAWGPCVDGKQAATRNTTRAGANCPILIKTQNCTFERAHGYALVRTNQTTAQVTWDEVVAPANSTVEQGLALCAGVCNTTAGCQGFVFIADSTRFPWSNKRCFTMPKSARNFTNVGLDPAWMYAKIPSGVITGYDYVHPWISIGTYIQASRTDDINTCENICTRDPKCKGFTFATYTPDKNRDCYIWPKLDEPFTAGPPSAFATFGIEFTATYRKQASASWRAYTWTALDWALITYDGFSQKTLCEDAAGFVFTQGNNTLYPGCSTAWCCMASFAPLPAWRRYGWSALERDLMSYHHFTEDFMCTSAGGKYTGGKNQAHPGCGGGVCCIPANATIPAWRPYGWSSTERDMMAKGANASSLCAAAGAIYTGNLVSTRPSNYIQDSDDVGRFRGCGDATCCIPSNSSLPACTVSEWSAWGPCVDGKQTANRNITRPGSNCPILTNTQNCTYPRTQGYALVRTNHSVVPVTLKEVCAPTNSTVEQGLAICAGVCNTTTGCQGFSVIVDDPKAWGYKCCFTMPNTGGDVTYMSLSNPGVMYSKIPSGAITGYDYAHPWISNGTYIQYLKTNDINNCSGICTKDPKCKGFTFMTYTRHSYLEGYCFTWPKLDEPFTAAPPSQDALRGDEFTATYRKASTSWRAYTWTALDWALITYDGFSQKTFCEDAAGFVFTQGNNTLYPGCSTAWCCMASFVPLPAWRRYGWSALERDLMSYDNFTEDSLCTSAGAKYTGGKNQAYPGCGGGVCCIPANATFPAWRPYGWSSIERSMMAKGATESSLCAAAGATYTLGNNRAYPGCGSSAVCCIRSNSSFPACEVSSWSAWGACLDNGFQVATRSITRAGANCPALNKTQNCYSYDEARCPSVPGYGLTNPYDYYVTNPPRKSTGMSLLRCSGLCNSTSGCIAFTFVPRGVNINSCYLTVLPLPTASTKLPDPGVTYSRSPAAEVGPFQYVGGQQPAVGGPPFIAFYANNYQECVNYCDDLPGCGGFTFSTAPRAMICSFWRFAVPPFTGFTPQMDSSTNLTTVMTTYKRVTGGKCPYPTGTFVNCTSVAGRAVYVIISGIAFPITSGLYEFTLKKSPIIFGVTSCTTKDLNGCGVGRLISSYPNSPGSWQYPDGAVVAVQGKTYLVTDYGRARPFSAAAYAAAGSPAVVQTLTQLPGPVDAEIPGPPPGVYLNLVQLFVNDVSGPACLVTNANTYGHSLGKGACGEGDIATTFSVYIADDVSGRFYATIVTKRGSCFDATDSGAFRLAPCVASDPHQHFSFTPTGSGSKGFNIVSRVLNKCLASTGDGITTGANFTFTSCTGDGISGTNLNGGGAAAAVGGAQIFGMSHVIKVMVNSSLSNYTFQEAVGYPPADSIFTQLMQAFDGRCDIGSKCNSDPVDLCSATGVIAWNKTILCEPRHSKTGGFKYQVKFDTTLGSFDQVRSNYNAIRSAVGILLEAVSSKSRVKVGSMFTKATVPRWITVAVEQYGLPVFTLRMDILDMTVPEEARACKSTSTFVLDLAGIMSIAGKFGPVFSLVNTVGYAICNNT